MAQTKLLQIRMTDKELEDTRQLAKRYDLDISKLVRMLIRKAKKQSREVNEFEISPREPE